MKINSNFFLRNSILLILVSIPLSYIALFGIRVLPIILIMGYFFILLNFKKILINLSLVSYIVLIAIVMLMCIYTGKFLSLFSVVFFFLIAYWPFFIDPRKITDIDFLNFINIYIYFGILMGVGVISQYYLYNNFGISIGKIDEYAERVGFGFIWNDFSFLSLYFTSMIPLVWYKRNSLYIKYFISIFLLISSIFTTARTGVYALFLFLFLFLFFEFFKFLFFNRKINLKIIFFAFIFIIPLIVIGFDFYLNNKESRFFSLDSSGRIDDHFVAFNYFENNMLFGSFYDVYIYREGAAVIPHNIFIYNLVLGGIVFFIVFLIWFISTASYLFRLRFDFIFYSFVICIIGFQFIPAVFTAYFFAFLISLMFYKTRLIVI